MSSGQTTVEEDPRRLTRGLHELAHQAGRLLGLLAVLALFGLILVALATGLQAQRDEARRSDLLLVLAPTVPPPAFVEHTFDLYRRGYAPRLLVIGDGRKQLLSALRERGLPADASAEAESATLQPAYVNALRAAQEEQPSALVVAPAEEILLTMKIARDMGLRTYGSPPPDRGIDLLAVLQTGARYWRYVLLGA